MGRGSKLGLKRTRVQPEGKRSDESDEEYQMSEEEEYDESDEYSSLDTDESAEFLADFEEDEEEDEEEENVKRVVRSKPAQKCSRQRKMNQVKRAQKKRRFSLKVEDDEVEEQDDDYEDEIEEQDDDYEDEDEAENKKCSRQRKMNQIKKPQRKRGVSRKIEDDEVEEKDDDYEAEDDREDEDDQKCSRRRKMNQIKKPQRKRGVSCKIEDDEVEEKDDDYVAEDEDEDENEDDQMCSWQRKMNQVKKPLRKRGVSRKIEDDEVEEQDDDYAVEDEVKDKDEDENDQICYRQRKRNQVKKPRRKRGFSPEVEDDEFEEKDDDYEVGDENEDEDEYGDEAENENEDDQICSWQRKRNHVKRPRRKRGVSPEVEDDEFEEKDDDYEFEDENEDEDEDEDEDEAENGDGDEDDQICLWQGKMNHVRRPQKKRGVASEIEDDEVEEKDDDYEFEDEDEDDEEFVLDEIDCADEEDEMPVMKKNKKVSRSHIEKRGLSKGKKRGRKSKVPVKPARQLSKKNCRFTRKTGSLKNAEVTEKSIVVQARSRNSYSQRKRSTTEDSDSNSEEEREQVREATKFCTKFNTNLRSSSMKSLQEEPVCPQRRRARRKGKEKVVDMKNEVIKQVCGICLSEEGKKTVRGSLDCCSHYFCFACIMEWSKVESRCPLCKQRFMTISKPARSITGLELRTVVVQVPERDQVYQPSEEELQGYLDPYENVICTECQQGGEDALMLLCDICDSPAHTFCVGLGREVPEGNWYCEGCRPAAFASLNPQDLSPMPLDQRTNNLSGPSSPFPRGIDLNEMYVPETPLTQETRIFSSFRRPLGDNHAASLVSGSGASTVSVRRRMRQQINSIILNNRTSQAFIRSNGVSASSPGVRVFGSQLDRGRALTPQRTTFPDTSISEGRLEGNDFTLAGDNRAPVSVRSDHFSGHVQNQTSAGSLQAEHGRFGMAFNQSFVHEQLQPCTSRSNIGADASLSPYACREVSHFNVEMGQVEQMVRSHLESLSGDNELGSGITFTDIARQCTNTVLAACGLEHRSSEVRPVQPSFVCNHLGMAGREMSLMKNNCSSCFNLFVKDVVTQITHCAM